MMIYILADYATVLSAGESVCTERFVKKQWLIFRAALTKFYKWCNLVKLHTG